MRTTSRPAAHLALFAAAGLTLLGACRSGQGAVDDRAASVGDPQPRFDGPVGVVEYLRAADDERAWGRFVDTLAPKHRASFVFISWFGAAYDAIGDPALDDRLAAVERRHGLDRDALNDMGEGEDGLRERAEEVLVAVDLPELLTEFRDLSAEPRVSYFGFDDGTPVVEREGDVAEVTLGKATLTVVEFHPGSWRWVPGGFASE